MAFDFKNVAKKVADNNSPILEGREKLTVEEIISRYPDGVTVTGADLLTGKHGTYAAATFAEEDGFYFNGGKSFTDIVKEWAKPYTPEGSTVPDCVIMSVDLAEAGGVKMRFEKTKTQSGNNFTKVEVVD